MYKQTILFIFNKELFSTNYTGYASETQNAKTDMLGEFVHGPNEEDQDFNGWLDMLVDTFVDDQDNIPDLEEKITKEQVLKAIAREPEFLADMKLEFGQLIDLCEDELFYKEDDEDAFGDRRDDDNPFDVDFNDEEE